jgi:hypothetical protein
MMGYLVKVAPGQHRPDDRHFFHVDVVQWDPIVMSDRREGFFVAVGPRREVDGGLRTKKRNGSGKA